MLRRNEQIIVWAKPDGGPLIGYVCYRELETGLYWVWGAHHIHKSNLASPATLAETRASHLYYQLDSLFDIDENRDPEEWEGHPVSTTFRTRSTTSSTSLVGMTSTGSPTGRVVAHAILWTLRHGT